MMQIIEHTGRRLRVRVGGLNGSLCTLDRDAGHAEVAHMFAGVPWRRERLALSDVSGACVTKRSTRKGYYPRIDGRWRTSLKMVVCSKEDALRAAQAIRDFLIAGKPADPPAT